MKFTKEILLVLILIVLVVSASFDAEEHMAEAKYYKSNVCMWIDTNGEAGWPDYKELGITKEDCSGSK